MHRWNFLKEEEKEKEENKFVLINTNPDINKLKETKNEGKTKWKKLINIKQAERRKNELHYEIEKNSPTTLRWFANDIEVNLNYS